MYFNFNMNQSQVLIFANIHK